MALRMAGTKIVPGVAVQGIKVSDIREPGHKSLSSLRKVQVPRQAITAAIYIKIHQ